ncbi:UspA domain-containing protein [Reticulomyxa filosa]|uniref:UspA domain-containing protein n=1 Tax=Reticulomyxa filosa TaxID=46433 RepID=X6LTW8_RETFI|nr:UspA domain-containing protein [Reticulomyxa filosa]|eukprot:ETO04811.1 UspA domain-containing protein [Reticulomyxa filosa]
MTNAMFCVGPFFLKKGMIIAEPEEIQKYNEEHLNNAKKLLISLYNAYLGKMKVLPLLVSSANQGKSYIGKLICGAAKALEVDLIIMGSRGLGKVKEFFVGSVSKNVVENAHCPVLVVKS